MNESSTDRPRVAWVLLPVAAALLLGILQACRQPSLERDGVAFLRYARYFDSALRSPEAAAPRRDDVGRFARFRAAVQRSEQHPGYPLMIVGVFRALHPDAPPPTGPEMESIARGIALAGLVLSVLAVYAVGRELFNHEVGLLSAWIFAVMPEAIHTGADALADHPALALTLLCLWAGLRHLRTAGLPALLACGVCGGTGYLVRPEALLPALAVMGWLGIRGVAGVGGPRGRSFVALAVLAHVAALYVIPLLAIKGTLETKPKWRLGSEPVVGALTVEPEGVAAAEFASGAVIDAAPAMLAAAANSADEPDFDPGSDASRASRILPGFRRWISHFWQDLRFVWPWPMYLGIWVARRRFVERPERLLPWVLVLANLLILVGWVYAQYGYIASRHLLPAIAVSIFWAPIGLRAMGEWFAPLSRAIHARLTRVYVPRKWTRLLRLHRRLKPTAANLAACAFFVGLMICVVRSAATANTDKSGFRLAGDRLLETGALGPDDRIIDPVGIAAFYARADAAGIRFHDEVFADRDRLAELLGDQARRRQPITRLVLDDRYSARVFPDGVPPRIDGVGRDKRSWILREIESFPVSSDDPDGRRVRVHRVSLVRQAR